MNLLLVLILGISLLAGEVFAGKCRTYHKVKKGESLWIIARKYDLRVKDLLRANPKLRRAKYLKPGQKVCVPHKKKIVKKKKIKKKRKVYKGYVIYRVRPGDSLRKIAKKFGVSWREIKRVNNLKSDIIRVGQKLKIPKKATAKRTKRKVRRHYRSREVVYIKYRVRRGDSLIKIAKRFGVSWKAIKRANNLRSNVIRRGQLLRIPVPKRAFERRYVDKPKIRLSFLPVDGEYRKSPKGLDIFASCGDKIRVVDDGRVIYSGDDLTLYGNMIMVEHTGYISIYAYNMQNLVEQGDRVSKGEVIGKVGIKPGSGRCALHFEIRAKDGSVLNPLEYLGKK